jgi:hypothetical protein
MTQNSAGACLINDTDNTDNAILMCDEMPELLTDLLNKE